MCVAVSVLRHDSSLSWSYLDTEDVRSTRAAPRSPLVFSSLRGPFGAGKVDQSYCVPALDPVVKAQVAITHPSESKQPGGELMTATFSLSPHSSSQAGELVHLALYLCLDPEKDECFMLPRSRA